MQSPIRASAFASASSPASGGTPTRLVASSGGTPARLLDGILSLDLHVSASINALEVGNFVTVTGRTGRSIAVLRTPNGLSAMDLRCYHHGAALGGADGRMTLVDIERIGYAVRCPAHGRYIDVTTGEQIMRSTSLAGCEHGGLDAACSWQRADGGAQQRVHEVQVDEAGGVHLRLSERTGDLVAVPSDAYNLTPHPSPRASPHSVSPHASLHASPRASLHASPHASLSPHSLAAFACRKSRATEAVQSKLSPGPLLHQGLHRQDMAIASHHDQATSALGSELDAASQQALVPPMRPLRRRTLMYDDNDAEAMPMATTASSAGDGDGDAMDIS